MYTPGTKNSDGPANGEGKCALMHVIHVILLDSVRIRQQYPDIPQNSKLERALISSSDNSLVFTIQRVLNKLSYHGSRPIHNSGQPA